jgi:hypothetical protein
MKDIKNTGNGFLFYDDWWQIIKDYSGNTRLEIYDAVMEYGLTGKKPTLEGVAKVAFDFIQLPLDRSKESYKKQCVINQRNGLKGGAPKGNNNAKNNRKQPKQPKTTIYNYNNKNNSQKKLEIQNKIFAAYQAWLNENAVYCAASENFKQLTAEELWELTNKYSPEKIKEAILNFESKKIVRKRETSLYKILNDFFKKINNSVSF